MKRLKTRLKTKDISIGLLSVFFVDSVFFANKGAA
jgi:hypothetical protein